MENMPVISVHKLAWARPAGDVEAFAAGLSRLIHDKSLREELSTRGLEFVQVNYSKERLIEDIKGLYAELGHKEAREVQLLPITRL